MVRPLRLEFARALYQVTHSGDRHEDTYRDDAVCLSGGCDDERPDPGLLCHGQEASGAIYVKLGVEPRTAAAGMGMSRIRQLHLEFEG